MQRGAEVSPGDESSQSSHLCVCMLLCMFDFWFCYFHLLTDG